MGLEIVVPRRGLCPLPTVLETLSAAGLPSTVAMVDSVLQGPGARLSAQWRDVRLRTPAGVVTLRRTASGIAVVVFGNADSPSAVLQILGAQARPLGDPGQHPRPDLLVIMKAKHEVCPPVAGERAVGAGLTLDLPPDP